MSRLLSLWDEEPLPLDDEEELETDRSTWGELLLLNRVCPRPRF